MLQKVWPQRNSAIVPLQTDVSWRDLLSDDSSPSWQRSGCLCSFSFCCLYFQYGHSALSVGTGFNGCYASHIVLSSGTAVISLPRNVSDKMAAPVNCALATMVNAVSNVPNDSSNCVAMIQVKESCSMGNAKVAWSSVMWNQCGRKCNICPLSCNQGQSSAKIAPENTPSPLFQCKTFFVFAFREQVSLGSMARPCWENAASPKCLCLT